VVECLPSKNKALSSNPRGRKEGKKKERKGGREGGRKETNNVCSRKGTGSEKIKKALCLSLKLILGTKIAYNNEKPKSINKHND
jgi:hypothetical protein